MADLCFCAVLWNSGWHVDTPLLYSAIIGFDDTAFHDETSWNFKSGREGDT